MTDRSSQAVARLAVPRVASVRLAVSRVALVRLAVAAAAVALSIWLVPASVHIVGWRSGASVSGTGPMRVALLAPVSRLTVAFIVCGAATGALAAAWRAAGGSLVGLADALLPLGWLFLWIVPFLPWLPDRAPVLLVLAGPLRWAAAALAVTGVVLAWTPRLGRAERARSMLGSTATTARRRGLLRAGVLAVSFAVYAGLGMQYTREMGFEGDEPHYLMIAESLWADHDLDIANNHAQRDYRSFYPGELRPDFLRRGLHGEIYSIHAPGLPALIIPAYAAGGALAVVVFIAALAALTALTVFDAATAIAGARAGAVAWAATCFTVPFVPHAWLIYPELPAALIVAWAVTWLRQPAASPARTFAHGAALAVLPWLHTKFVVFLALFAAFELVKILSFARGSAGGERPAPFTRLAALGLPVAVSCSVWLYSFYRMYGVLDPQAPYGNYTQMFVLARNIPRGMLGLLFDQKFGLLAYSPVYLLVIPGAWIMLRQRADRLFAAQLLVTAAAFFVSSTRIYMWWGGTSAPARFLVPVVPLFAPLVAVAISRLESVAGRALVVSTVVLSLAVAVLTLGSPGEELLYSAPHGVAALTRFVQGGAPLDAALPTFTEEDWRAPIAQLLPWLAALGTIAVLTVWVTRRTRATHLRASRAVFWTATAAGVGVLIAGSVLTGLFSLRAISDRQAIVVRGQRELLAEYDPSRLLATDVTHVRRLDEKAVLTAASLTFRRPPGAAADNPRVLAGPFDLPEGRYEARIWFEGSVPPGSEGFVGLTDQVLLAHRPAAGTSPLRLAFELPIRAPAFVGVSDALAALSVRRVDIVPVALLPWTLRERRPSHVVEPTGGAIPSFMAYLDDRTYPEGGVFWTRDTREGAVVIATAGASSLNLILHVGPTGGPVSIEAGGRRLDVSLGPDETREVTVPLPVGVGKITVSVKASRAFRPAEVDPKSDDGRLLGCQVRPLLS